jgi:hypothetical protein
MSRPPHPPRLYNSNYTWRSVQIMKPSLCSFFHPAITPSLFGPNILLNTLYSNTLSLCSSLTIRDHVSHPYRTTGKIIVLYILTFTFFDSRREEKCSGPNGSMHYQNSISSWFPPESNSDLLLSFPNIWSVSVSVRWAPLSPQHGASSGCGWKGRPSPI